MSLGNKYPIPALKNRDDELDIVEEDAFFLMDGRPVRLRVWKEGEGKYVGYYFSTADIEEYNKKKLVSYLGKNGIAIDPNYLDKIIVSKGRDSEANVYWELIIAVDKP